MQVLIYGTGYIANALSGFMQRIYKAEVAVVPFREKELAEHIRSKFLSGLGCNLIIVGGVTRLVRNDSFSFLENVNNLSSFLNELEFYDVRSVIFLSTIDVYGQDLNQLPLTEATQINPDDFYSMAKVVSEFMVRKFAEKKKVPYLLARLTGVFGPADMNRSAISKMINSALVNKSVTLNGDGKIYRDFLYVDDLCKIIGLYLVAPRTLGVVNCASGITIGLLEIANYLSKKLKVDILYSNENNSPQRARRVEINNAFLKRCFPMLEFLEWQAAINKCINAASPTLE